MTAFRRNRAHGGHLPVSMAQWIHTEPVILHLSPHPAIPESDSLRRHRYEHHSIPNAVSVTGTTTMDMLVPITNTVLDDAFRRLFFVLKDSLQRLQDEIRYRIDMTCESSRN